MRSPSPPLMLALFLAVRLSPGLAQTDPGVQSGIRTNPNTGVSTGGTLIPQGDTTGFAGFFTKGQNRFQDVESVSGNPNGNNGLLTLKTVGSTTLRSGRRRIQRHH